MRIEITILSIVKSNCNREQQQQQQQQQQKRTIREQLKGNKKFRVLALAWIGRDGMVVLQRDNKQKLCIPKVNKAIIYARYVSKSSRHRCYGCYCCFVGWLAGWLAGCMCSHVLEHSNAIHSQAQSLLSRSIPINCPPTFSSLFECVFVFVFVFVLVRIYTSIRYAVVTPFAVFSLRIQSAVLFDRYGAVQFALREHYDFYCLAYK